MAIQARINQIPFYWKGLKKIFKKGADVAISNYLDESLVLFLDVPSRDAALAQLILSLKESSRLKNVEQFHQAILDREKIVSTGVGLGVAIPHAKLKGYSDFFIAIGILKHRGLDWNALDGCDVRLIFLIGGPDNKQTEYLKILSHVTMAIKNEERRKKMLKATHPQEVIALFAGYDGSEN